MTRAERQKVASECMKSLLMRTWTYEEAGLTTEEACKRAWDESEEVPEECREEMKEELERFNSTFGNSDWLEDNRDRLEQIRREIIAKRHTTKDERRKMAAEYGKKLRERLEFHFQNGCSVGEAMEPAMEDIGPPPDACSEEMDEILKELKIWIDERIREIKRVKAGRLN